MWDWEYAWSILPDLLLGLVKTVQATLGGFLAACVIGLLMALLRRSENRWVSLPSGWVIDFIRFTPLLVQVVFLYKVGPLVIGTYIPSLVAGIIALGLHYGTYLSEVYRSGIDNVPKGQWEAATALNFTPYQKWVNIILPQAIPPIIPVMGNYLITMFKETPMLAAVLLAEMLLKAKSLVSKDFAFLEPYTMVGILFLLVSYPSAVLVRSLEKRLNQQRGV